MTTDFTNVFGGSAISSTDVAFAEYSFAADLTLFWPSFSNGEANVAARFMNLEATVASLDVFMPDAMLVSVGYDVVIFNAGSETFNIVDYDGGAIATIATGEVFYILLNDNADQAGGWQTVQFGVGTGSAVASELAGAGLLAIAGLLNVNFNGTTVSNSYALTMASRAILQIWTGGTGTITLPTASSVGNGFFFPLANNGSGDVTVTASGGDEIDGGATSVFSQTQSGFVISSGTGWYTVGKGLQNNFAVTLLNLNVAGSSDVTETSAQAQNIIQQYTGILTGDINVIVPNTVQLYYVFNDTTGSFSLTVTTALGMGVTVAQGTHSIVYCDGTDVINGYTASVSSTVSLSAGSANSPNLNFVGSGSTGIYSPSANQFAITAGGYEVMNFISAASSVNYLQSSASATGNPVSISALGTDGDIGINLTPKGTGTVNIAKANITGGLATGITLNNSVIGGVTPAAITGTTITANSSFVGNITGNVTGNVVGNVTGNITGDVTGNVSGNAGTVTTINGRIAQGTNVTITGSGTAGSPYTINSSSSGGTVTSVAMTGDNVIYNTSITGSPVTTSGTLVPVLKTQTANTVLAGPTSGGAATPTFRSLVAADIPSLTIALSSLAAQAANTVVANATSGSASPTAVALSTQQVLGRLGGDITGITVGTSANNIVQLNGSGQLPAVSGALLTNLPTTAPLFTPVTMGSASTLVITVDFATYGSYDLLLFKPTYSVSFDAAASSNAGGAYSTFNMLGAKIATATTTSISAVPQGDGTGMVRLTFSQPVASGDISVFADGVTDNTPTTFQAGGTTTLSAACNRIKLTTASGSFANTGYYILIPTSRR